MSTVTDESLDKVKALKAIFEEVREVLNANGQPSLSIEIDNHSRKLLVLSAGSYFETAITEILSEFCRKTSNNDKLLVKFLRNQAIEQKYYQLFDWGERDEPDCPAEKANKFFSLFDEKTRHKEDVKNDPKLDKSIKAFLALGHLRNFLVHSNLAAYDVSKIPMMADKTAGDIFDQFEEAKYFLVYLRKFFSLDKEPEISDNAAASH